ncbi:MAG TPA: LysR family transcriptional regulator [Bacillales bacterium]|nr:LysR family transcriptional regulator [Bacillales bacterium]
MDFNQLETFYKLSEVRNFSRAAKVMHLSQPSVTARIRNLEISLDCTLFNREGKNLTLTSEGEALVEYAEQILPSVKEAKRAIKSINKPKLSVGFCPAFSFTLLSNTIEDFVTESGTVLSVIEGMPSFSLFNKVVSEEVDVAFLRNPYYNDSLVIEPFYKDRWEVCVSVDHPLNNLDTISKEDLKGHTVITYGRNSDVWKKYEDTFLGVNSLNKIEIRNIELLKRLVQNGAGFSFLPLLSLIEPIRDNEISLKKLENFKNYNSLEDIYLIYKQDSCKTELIKQFISVFDREIAKNIEALNVTI